MEALGEIVGEVITYVVIAVAVLSFRDLLETLF